MNAILVYVPFSKKDDKDWNLREFLSLSFSAGIKVVDIFTTSKISINVKYFISFDKVLELQKVIKNSSVSVILFSNTLSASQERNLSFFLKCEILDRNQLILNIFAQRARTYSGKLQVKLARLRYLNSRLTHEWKHLERQKGGIGLRGGPGEMQLENDRRLIKKQIANILIRIKKIKNQREQNRRNRYRNNIPTVSLVGYTNAGKSTLFNIMTKSNVDTAEKLFSTLDPTFRKIVYQEGSTIILADTVGFIQNLPEGLMSSFQVTLQEATESTLLLHVVDASNQRLEQNINIVHNILSKVNINNVPILLVMNKIDRLDRVFTHIDRDQNGLPIKVWISAKEDVGIALLIQAINELLSNYMIDCKLKIPADSNLCKELYQWNVVKRSWMEDSDNIIFKIYLSSTDWNRLLKRNKILKEYIVSSM